jgi:hypothetical protein
VRYFPDKLPIGVMPGLDHHAFVYLVTRPSPMDFRLFLLRHVPLLRVLFRWTIRLLFPRSLWKARLVYQHAAREHLGERLEPANVQVLEWLFPERKRPAEPSAGPADERYLTTSRTSARPDSELCTASGSKTRQTRCGWLAQPRFRRARARSWPCRVRRALASVPPPLSPSGRSGRPCRRRRAR